MRKYIIRRIIDSLLTLLFIIVVNFILFRLMPGDPIKLMVRAERLTPSMVDYLMKLHGLDLPIWQQFFIYVKNLLTFQFGLSFQYHSFVAPLLLSKLWNSIILLLASTILAILLGTAFGLVAGWYRGKPMDLGLVSLSLFFWSMPTFWLAMVFAAAFSGVLPISGMRTLTLSGQSFFVSLLDLLRHLILPTIVMTVLYIGETLILTRNEVTNILSQDYIMTSKAKGLKSYQIISRHILRNASLPLVSNAGLSFAFLVGGALQTEIIFSWPGIGRLIYDSVLARDYPVLEGSFFILALAVLIANLLTDISYKFLDPRVEY